MNWGTEYVWLISLAGFCGFLANVLYMLGGTAGFGLLTRRAWGSFVLTFGTNLVAVVLNCWVWQYLLLFPLLWAGFSLGYGSDDIWTKVWKRFIFACGVVASCGIGVWVHNADFPSLVVLGLAFVTGLGSVVLGVVNPWNNAPIEQYIICNLLTMYVITLPFIK